jgi:UDP-galactopyranose mutase
MQKINQLYGKEFHNTLLKCLQEQLHVKKGKSDLEKFSCEDFLKIKVYRCYLNKMWSSQGVPKRCCK